MADGQHIVDLARNANKAPTTLSTTLHMQGGPSLAKPLNEQHCKGWLPLRMRGGTFKWLGPYLCFS